MGEVWRGLDEALGRPVAIKILRNLTDPVLVARFRQEGRLQASVKHDNVLQIHDQGVTSEGGHLLAYLVMELLPGPTLEHILAARGPLPIQRAVQLADQVAAALEAAHRVGVIHRDVKPANLMFDDGGRLKVLDFGVARLRTDNQRLTGTGIAVGTPTYLSPEQAAGGQATEASDVYSLGCLLFEMLTGAPPFTGPDRMSLLAQHITRDAPRLADETAGTVPAAIDDLVARMLAKQPADRPAVRLVRTVLRHPEMSEANRRAAAAEKPAPTPPDSPAPLAAPPARRLWQLLRTRSPEPVDIVGVLNNVGFLIDFNEGVGNLTPQRARWLRGHVEKIRSTHRRDPGTASISLAYLDLAVEALAGVEDGDALAGLHRGVGDLKSILGSSHF